MYKGRDSRAGLKFLWKLTRPALYLSVAAIAIDVVFDVQGRIVRAGYFVKPEPHRHD